MSSSFPTVVIPSRLHRVSRTPDPAALPAWEYAGDDRTFANRWDDPHGRYRVLYTSDTRIGALAETLQDFRRSLTLLSRLQDVERDDPELARTDSLSGRGSGIVPSRFFDERFAGELTFAANADSPTGRVVDVAQVDAIETLRTKLASFAVALGIEEISLATIVGTLPTAVAPNPRALTQRISREIYESPDLFAGIAAPSSLGLPYTNYTLFENPDARGPDHLRLTVRERSSRRLDRNDADVRHALEHLGLSVEETPVRKPGSQVPSE